jgi:hypothetical protein
MKIFSLNKFIEFQCKTRKNKSKFCWFWYNDKKTCRTWRSDMFFFLHSPSGFLTKPNWIHPCFFFLLPFFSWRRKRPIHKQDWIIKVEKETLKSITNTSKWTLTLKRKKNSFFNFPRKTVNNIFKKQMSYNVNNNTSTFFFQDLY